MAKASGRPISGMPQSKDFVAWSCLSAMSVPGPAGYSIWAVHCFVQKAKHAYKAKGRADCSSCKPDSIYLISMQIAPEIASWCAICTRQDHMCKAARLQFHAAPNLHAFLDGLALRLPGSCRTSLALWTIGCSL